MTSFPRRIYLALRRRMLYRRCLRAPSRTVVLRYHSIGEPHDVARYLDPGLSLTPARFKEQLRALSRRFEFAPPAVLANGVPRAGARPRAILTFDDGYRDNHDVVLPILREEGAVAAFYVTTAPLSAGRSFWISELWRLVPRLTPGPLDIAGLAVPEDPAARTPLRRTLTRFLSGLEANERERVFDSLAARASVPRGEGLDDAFMRPEHVRALADAGMTVGAHTRTHPHLDRLGAAAHDDEVRGSRLDLEAILGRPVEHFAYPNPSGGGAVTAPARAAVEAAGFATSVTSIAAPLDESVDRLRVPRLGVYAGTQEQLLFRLLERM